MTFGMTFCIGHISWQDKLGVAIWNIFTAAFWQQNWPFKCCFCSYSMNSGKLICCTVHYCSTILVYCTTFCTIRVLFSLWWPFAFKHGAFWGGNSTALITWNVQSVCRKYATIGHCCYRMQNGEKFQSLRICLLFFFLRFLLFVSAEHQIVPCMCQSEY